MPGVLRTQHAKGLELFNRERELVIFQKKAAEIETCLGGIFVMLESLHEGIARLNILPVSLVS